MRNEPPKHWLYRKDNRPRLWVVQICLLVLVVLPEFFVHRHAHFESLGTQLDASWGFFAWYGFLTCAAMVVGAKLLGALLKRDERYYDD